MKRRIRRLFIDGLIIMGVFSASVFSPAQTVMAALIAVNNAGFEDVVVADGFDARGPGSIPGWTLFLNSGDTGGTFNPSTGSYLGEAPEGQNVAFSGVGGPIISQILSVGLTANTNYTLTMEVGNRLDLGFPGYNIQLLAGGNVLAEDNNSLSPASGEFSLSTVSFFASAADPFLGQALEIRLDSFGQQANFDDVRLDASTAVPIPAAAWLFGSALGLLGWIKRKAA